MLRKFIELCKSNMAFQFMLPLLLCLVASSLKLTSSYVCDDHFCAKSGCKTAAKCDSGRWIKDGGLCGCCDLCVKSLGENDPCSTRGENGFPNFECGAGLACDGTKKKCVPRNSTCVLDRQEYDSFKQNGSLMIGRIRPQCDYMGDYAGPQCIFGSVCFCVDENGDRIFGTGHYTKIDSLHCGCSRSAERLADDIGNMQSILVPYVFTFSKSHVDGEIRGRSLPPFAHCMPDGRYDGLQCVGDTCFCIDDRGERLLQQDMVNVNVKSVMLCYDPTYHEESYYRTCELEMQSAVNYATAASTRTNRLGVDPPRCDLDGTYAPVQCRDDKCYCVYANGSRIGYYEVSRYDEAVNMNCYCARDRVFITDPFLASQVKCEKNGSYAPLQCQGSLCFCVNSSGLQVGPEVDITRAESLDCFATKGGHP